MLISGRSQQNIGQAWSRRLGARHASLILMNHKQLSAKARYLLRHERLGHSLAPSDLLQSLYLRLHPIPTTKLQDKNGFLGLCHRMMKNLLVDHARKKKHLKQKLGGSLPERLPAQSNRNLSDRRQILDLALQHLEGKFPHKAQIARMMLAGEKAGQIGAALGKDKGYVDRHWASARKYLEAEVTRLQGR